MNAKPMIVLDAEGSSAFWALDIPTTQACGLHARVRLHSDGMVSVRLYDADGEWSRGFLCPEDYTEWLDYISAGPVVMVDYQRGRSHMIRVGV